MAVDAAFTSKLPKIELHAHLTGSISRGTLHDIWRIKKDAEPRLALQDPLVAIPPGGLHDIKTFFPLFSSYIYQLCSDLPSIEFSTRRVLSDFQADGVVYLELRTTPRASPAHSITKDLYVSTILSILRSHNADPANTLHAALILSIDRRNSLAEAHETVDLALKHRPFGVVGLDLCGDPSVGGIAKFAPTFQRAKEAGLGITLHFAELAASATDEELWELLRWRPGRIGHVIHVKGEIKDEIVRQGVGVELCLSCNVQLKMHGEGGYEGHHFGWWRGARVGVALSTDDVGVFQSPLSEEYRLAAEHFRLGRDDVRKLCEGAVETIFGSEAEKERLRVMYRGWDGWIG
ncbi:Metallo-dependent hydrolase [Mytilinidion resinicola]|uniref:Metallo-dependent hydrolase n=1 Tax=Mytilinidion resinicola TaxID=574789 RepID=A0A6A6YD58_9PEZI|nr:Metallo-dependent hydrolase [Mytilinidion resinicola]KAF2806529.1 Metallo-dependent hydrolase [Mytilinidion resinicola]